MASSSASEVPRACGRDAPRCGGFGGNRARACDVAFTFRTVPAVSARSLSGMDGKPRRGDRLTGGRSCSMRQAATHCRGRRGRVSQGMLRSALGLALAAVLAANARTDSKEIGELVGLYLHALVVPKGKTLLGVAAVPGSDVTPKNRRRRPKPALFAMVTRCRRSARKAFAGARSARRQHGHAARGIPPCDRFLWQAAAGRPLPYR